MRRAIGEPCRPAALAALGLEERDAVDLEESLGLLDENRPPGLSLRTLFHGLFRGSCRLGLLSLLLGPRPWVSEVGASRQAVIARRPMPLLAFKAPVLKSFPVTELRVKAGPSMRAISPPLLR